MKADLLRIRNHERKSKELEIKTNHESGDLHFAADKALKLYGSEISAWLIRRYENNDTAVEMYSEFSLYFWQWFPTFAWESSLRTWMYSIARSVCYSNLPRHHYPLSQVPKDISALIVNQCERISTYKCFGAEDACQKLSDRVLTKEDRDLLIWRIDRQMSWQDIARILSDAPYLDEEECRNKATALRVRFNRIKKKLRSAAEKEGLVR